MEINKEYQIKEVRAMWSTSAPFTVVLQDGYPHSEDLDSTLLLNQETCTRYNIPISLGLAGRTLLCSLQSREAALLEDGDFRGSIDWAQIQGDDLGISVLKRRDLVQFAQVFRPIEKFESVQRVLRLSTFGEGDGIHPHPLPVPFYRLNILLNEEEYEACKALSPSSIFKVEFTLKS